MDGMTHASDPNVDLRATLASYDSETDRRWDALVDWLRQSYDRDITLEAILFLIGIQTRGRGFEPDLAREKKQDVIMEGTFSAFASLGVYERVGMEDDGAWIWERVAEPIPDLSVDDQEKLLKIAVLRYFQEELGPGALG